MITIEVQGREVATRAAITGLAEDAGEILGDPDDVLLASALRHAAVMRCPCSRRELVDAVTGGFSRLNLPPFSNRDRVAAALDDLIASGDLLATRVTSPAGPLVIQLAPPSFVRRANGSVWVVGGLADVGTPIPAQVREAMRSRGSYRTVAATAGRDVIGLLIDAGFSEYPADAWLEAPPAIAAGELVRRVDALLDRAASAGTLESIEILDGNSSPRNYRRRWRSPAKAMGRYICRAVTRWGGDAWMYAEIAGGEAIRFVRLPLVDPRFRGCDEAWWLQSALDHLRGQSQHLDVANAPDGRMIISAYSPLPMWAERRLRPIGEFVDPAPGALLTFACDPQHGDEEAQFLVQRLWMEKVKSTLET